MLKTYIFTVQSDAAVRSLNDLILEAVTALSLSVPDGLLIGAKIASAGGDIVDMFYEGVITVAAATDIREFEGTNIGDQIGLLDAGVDWAVVAIYED